MGAKEECRELLAGLIGQATADMIDSVPEENCIEETKKVLTDIFGEKLALQKIEPIENKYLSKGG